MLVDTGKQCLAGGRLADVSWRCPRTRKTEERDIPVDPDSLDKRRLSDADATALMFGSAREDYRAFMEDEWYCDMHILFKQETVHPLPWTYYLTVEGSERNAPDFTAGDALDGWIASNEPRLSPYADMERTIWTPEMCQLADTWALESLEIHRHLLYEAAHVHCEITGSNRPQGLFNPFFRRTFEEYVNVFEHKSMLDSPSDAGLVELCWNQHLKRIEDEIKRKGASDHVTDAATGRMLMDMNLLGVKRIWPTGIHAAAEKALAGGIDDRLVLLGMMHQLQGEGR